MISVEIRSTFDFRYCFWADKFNVFVPTRYQIFMQIHLIPITNRMQIKLTFTATEHLIIPVKQYELKNNNKTNNEICILIMCIVISRISYFILLLLLDCFFFCSFQLSNTCFSPWLVIYRNISIAVNGYFYISKWLFYKLMRNKDSHKQPILLMNKRERK